MSEYAEILNEYEDALTECADRLLEIDKRNNSYARVEVVDKHIVVGHIPKGTRRIIYVGDIYLPAPLKPVSEEKVPAPDPEYVDENDPLMNQEFKTKGQFYTAAWKLLGMNKSRVDGLIDDIDLSKEVNRDCAWTMLVKEYRKEHPVEKER